MLTRSSGECGPSICGPIASMSRRRPNTLVPMTAVSSPAWIAATTGGRYFEARSADQLSSIYRSLGRSLGWTVQPREVSGFLAALAGLVLLGSLAVSELLVRRIL